MIMKKLFVYCMLAALSIFISCSSLPEGAKPVENFEKEKYLGKWYEIARLDVSFERNLNNTSAEYSLNEDGTIQVVNRGYNTKKRNGQKLSGRRNSWVKKISAGSKSLFWPFLWRIQCGCPGPGVQICFGCRVES